MKTISNTVLILRRNYKISIRLICSAVLCMIIGACGGNLPRQAPNVVIEDAHSGGSALAFSNDSSMAASGGWSGYVRIWDMPEGRNKVTWRAHEGQVNGVVFLQNDTQILTGGYDKKIVLWDINGRQLRSVSSDSPITHLVSAPARDLIVTAHQDGVARQWRLSDFKLIAQEHHHHGSLISVAIHPESGRMASSGSDGEVWVWNSSENPQRLEDPATDVRTLAFSPDGHYLFGGAWFNLYRWRIADGSRKSIATSHQGIIKQIQFAPGGDYLASISRQTDSAVLFLNADNGETIRRFNSHDLCGGAISISPDGRFLGTTSDDASVRFWYLQNPT